jgi:hypothetical protein
MALTDDQLFQLSFDFFTHRGDSWRDYYVTASIQPKGIDAGAALIAYARAAIALEKQQEAVAFTALRFTEGSRQRGNGNLFPVVSNSYQPKPIIVPRGVQPNPPPKDP